MKIFHKVLFWFVAIMLLVGCSSSDDKPSGGGNDSKPAVEQSEKDPDSHYEVPEYAEAVFNEAEAEGEGDVWIDLSSVEEGYVAVSAKSENRLKFQVIKDETYNYDMNNDGTPSIFPLQSGDGEYSFRVMEHIADNKYAALYETSADVSLIDEFQPYIRTNDYVSYNRNSNCVKLASEFASNASDALDLINEVFSYVCDNIVYDSDKASSVETGYIPDPDETLSSQKGICFDYASLTAAMFRSQGIPTKVIFGYVSPNNLYHAWNMIYTTEQGWIVAEFKMDQNNWNRVDLTFSANGADADFIGDGSNYTGIYQY